MGVVINFDSTSVVPSTGVMDAMPAGWYIAAMDQSDSKPTKDGSGMYLELRFDILDGQYKGRKVFARLNVKNNNPQAVEIAYKDLAAICHAVGAVGLVQSTDMLHGRPLKLKLKVRPATGEYEANNEISAYRNVNDQTAVNGAAAAGQAVNPGMPANFPPPAQTGNWAPAQGGQPAPQQGYAPPQQPAQGQPSYQPPQQPQQPAQGQQWQQPQGGQPWQPPQQPVQQPQQQFAQPQPGGNPAANQPPPWG